MISVLILLLMVSVVINTFLFGTTRIYAGRLREVSSRTPTELPTPVILDGDEHVHMWGKWEDAVLGKWVKGEFIRTNTGQRRSCTICGERQVSKRSAEE